MNKLTPTLLAGGALALTAACTSLELTQDQANVEPTNDEMVTIVQDVAEEAVWAEAEPWPPADCLNEDQLKAFLADPNNRSYAGYLGLYSGGTNPAENGNLFWIGTNHGAKVQQPDTPTNIPASPKGQGYVIRWNIGDTVVGAGQHLGNHYRWDYDATRDDGLAVQALALNTCETDQLGNVGSCQQPLFGTYAWQQDIKKGPLKEFCPPVIMSDDPESIYLYDKNDDAELEVYEYSLGLVMTGGGAEKKGLRIIIDPRVRNNGVGTINK